jgi:hypothetical protein
VYVEVEDAVNALVGKAVVLAELGRIVADVARAYLDHAGRLGQSTHGIVAFGCLCGGHRRQGDQR